MKTVVTGATGHVGNNLIRLLCEQGRSVRALVHIRRQETDIAGVEIAKADICDQESLCRVFDGAEVVYHLAAIISLSMDDWHSLEEVNIKGTRNVVEACIRCGVRRLVYFSTIHTMVQEPMNMTLDEYRPLLVSRCCPPYDRSKADAEREVLKGIKRGLDAVIINPTGIIGPYDYEPSYFGSALLMMAKNKLPALVNGGFDWVDVRDVVEGAVNAEKLAMAGTKYILSGHWVSMADLAALVSEVTGTSIPRLVFPMWIARLGIPVVALYDRLSGRRPFYTEVALQALASNRNISHERATHDLGYRPRPFQYTVADTLRWFRETGYLR